jgi:hypothetical protein
MRRNSLQNSPSHRHNKVDQKRKAPSIKSLRDKKRKNSTFCCSPDENSDSSSYMIDEKVNSNIVLIF